MTRNFHNAPGGAFALAATLLIAAAGYLLWMKLAIAGALLLVLAALYIEREIHTEYTISGQKPDSSPTLTIHRGRLSRTTVIPLEAIATATIVRPARLFLLIPRPALVVIVLRTRPRPVIVTPANPEGFLKTLTQCAQARRR